MVTSSKLPSNNRICHLVDACPHLFAYDYNGIVANCAMCASAKSTALTLVRVSICSMLLGMMKRTNQAGTPLQVTPSQNGHLSCHMPTQHVPNAQGAQPCPIRKLNHGFTLALVPVAPLALPAAPAASSTGAAAWLTEPRFFRCRGASLKHERRYGPTRP